MHEILKEKVMKPISDEELERRWKAVREVMKEKNIDLSHHTSKSIDRFREMWFDYVITVCDDARETCPVFPHGKEFLHKRFEDPTQGTGKKEDKRVLFRRVRDEIRSWIVQTFGQNRA